MSRRLDEQNREGLLLPHAHDHYPPARCIHRGSSVLSIKACRAGKTRRTSSSSCLDRLPPTMFLLDAGRSRAWQPPLFRMQSRQRTPHVCRLLDTRPARPPSSYTTIGLPPAAGTRDAQTSGRYRSPRSREDSFRPPPVIKRNPHPTVGREENARRVD